MQKLINTHNSRITVGTEFINQDGATEVSDCQSKQDYDSEDDDLNTEDRRLRREILRNFIASTKVTKQSTGRFTTMQMTFPEEKRDYNRMSRRGYTPVDTENSVSEHHRRSSKINSDAGSENSEQKIGDCPQLRSNHSSVNDSMDSQS